MENIQKIKGNWKKFMIFSLSIGSIVGFFSVISDNLQFLNDGITTPELIVSYLAVMINSLPMWFIVAMIVGKIFAKNFKEAVFLGALYIIIAITFYFVIGNFYESIISVEPVPSSLKEKVIAYLLWYGASTVGGVLGGGAGFLFKKTPYVLLVIIVGLIVQLFKNGERSWEGTLGVSQNLSYCLMIVSIVIYLIVVRIKKNLIKYEGRTLG